MFLNAARVTKFLPRGRKLQSSRKYKISLARTRADLLKWMDYGKYFILSPMKYALLGTRQLE